MYKKYSNHQTNNPSTRRMSPSSSSHLVKLGYSIFSTGIALSKVGLSLGLDRPVAVKSTLPMLCTCYDFTAGWGYTCVSYTRFLSKFYPVRNHIFTFSQYP